MRCFRCCCAARARRTLSAVSSRGFAQVLREQLKDSELKSLFTDTNQVHTSRTPTAPLPSPHSLSRLQLFIHPPFSQTRDRTSAILDEHKDAQRQEKAADPTRFIPERKKAASPPVGRTASRPMPSGQDAPLGVVEFKEVQVRAIDPKTLAAVRASLRYIFRRRNQNSANLCLIAGRARRSRR